ncbi:hypothetical protein DN069_20260 [Streptacidiphilus pinicola]|uniref:Uncharacterized protein n=1 Tax=Streptacidiphilus pinicola TaxID=2219663 RepID=A0A2X0K9K4_9ACTN|nr:hypothetical protein [Streptacidiphilus pinicola]RAG83780.1 hypothetical protein DN069_20260 [Streptacidiphilus pinicola]
MQQPILNLSSWSVEDVEAHMAGLSRGQELERVRVVAQTRVYRSTEPREVRLRWARLALAANERFHDNTPWAQARMCHQEFSLRSWVIEHLGPDADPDWNPQALATDTLAALPLDPHLAGSLARGWRELPIEQIGTLRRCKNLTAHVDRLMLHLPPGLIRDQLEAWASVRENLP